MCLEQRCPGCLARRAGGATPPPLSAPAVVCCAHAEARYSVPDDKLGCRRTWWAPAGLNLNPGAERHSQPVPAVFIVCGEIRKPSHSDGNLHRAASYVRRTASRTTPSWQPLSSEAGTSYEPRMDSTCPCADCLARRLPYLAVSDGGDLLLCLLDFRAGCIEILGCFTQYSGIGRIAGELGKAPFEVF